MAKQWRNLGILAAIVVVAIGAYLALAAFPILPAKTAFERNFERIELIWAEQGIPIKGMDSTVHAWVYDLSEDNLDDVGDALVALRAENAGKDTATDALIEVYLSYIAWIRKDKAVVSLSGELDAANIDTVCTFLPQMKERNTMILESVELGKRYSAKAEAFDSTYVEAATIAGVYIPVVDEAWLEGNAATRAEAVRSIEQSCGGAV